MVLEQLRSTVPLLCWNSSRKQHKPAKSRTLKTASLLALVGLRCFLSRPILPLKTAVRGNVYRGRVRPVWLHVSIGAPVAVKTSSDTTDLSVESLGILLPISCKRVVTKSRAKSACECCDGKGKPVFGNLRCWDDIPSVDGSSRPRIK